MDFGEGQASFISLYAPNRNPARNIFFAGLTGLIDLSRPTFVAGDFNAVLDPAKDRMRDPSYVAGPAAQQRESIPALESLMSFTQTYPVWRQLHPGRTQASRIIQGMAPRRRGSTWCGLQLHYLITSRGVSTIHPSLATTNIYWWNLICNNNLTRGRGCGS